MPCLLLAVRLSLLELTLPSRRLPTLTSFAAIWARLLHVPLLSAQEVLPFLLALPSFGIAHLVSFPPVRSI